MTQSLHNIHISILNESGRFDSILDAIRVQTNNAIELARTKIQLSDVDIIFSYNPVETIPHLGFGGYTPDAHTVQISVDMDNAELVCALDEELVHTLLHEFHHAMRLRSVGYGDTLVEALVTEGLADHFSVEATGGAPSLWTQGFSNEELEALLVCARAEFDKTDYSHEDWFFGGNGLPKWGGYALGYFIVGKYLAEHPGVTAASLCNVEAREILK
ncbi:MAG: hypothetical protein QG607_400 [Patescibacteria group bacterium]|nr:hypothetical protein [Patescibacteria group bacterium]